MIALWLLSAAVSRIPVILIADPGVDDAGALLLALGSPSLEILGVISSFGCHGDPKVTARNSRSILAAANRSDIPVIAGANWPLGLDDYFRNDGSPFHGPDGLGGLLGSLDESKEAECTAATNVSGAEFIVSHARSRPGEIELVSFSPLTSVALAIGLEPRLPSLIKRLLVMGGAVDGAGNASPLAEANFVHDAAAARVVFASWGSAPGAGQLVMAPLEVTHQSFISEKEVVQVFGKVAGPAADLFVNSWPFYQGAYCSRCDDCCEGAPLHDAHPITYLLEPSMYTKSEVMRVRILVSEPGDPVHGMSLVDRRLGAKARREKTPIQAGECDALVLLEVHRKRFVEVLMDAAKVLRATTES